MASRWLAAADSSSESEPDVASEPKVKGTKLVSTTLDNWLVRSKVPVSSPRPKVPSPPLHEASPAQKRKPEEPSSSQKAVRDHGDDMNDTAASKRSAIANNGLAKAKGKAKGGGEGEGKAKHRGTGEGQSQGKS